MPTSRCSAEQDDIRMFVDALRNWLGLAPLYAPETPSVYGEECSVAITGYPREGRQGGCSVRHEVRLTSVEDEQRARAREMVTPRSNGFRPMRLRNRKRWDWDKARSEAAE